MAKRDQKRPTIRLRRISRLSWGIEKSQDIYTECPFWLENDDTAFATVMTDSSFGPLVPNGTYMYMTKRRDPIVGDLAFLLLADGEPIFRFICKVQRSHYEVLRYPDMDGEVIRETIPFHNISEFGVVAGTRRI